MATQDSIVGGLFTSPEQYQQAQNNAAMEQGIKLAQLDPFQRASAQMSYAGHLAGGAIGGALGGEDPQLKLQSMRNQLAQGMDLTSSEGWSNYAKKLQGNQDLQGAAQAAQKATEIQSGAELKQAKLTQATDLRKQQDEASMERLKERLASEERMNLNTNETRRAMAQLAASLKGEKPLTEFQGKAVTFGTRAAESSNILDNIAGDYSSMGVNYLPSFMNSAKGQQAQQAQSNFVNAVLRQESGAAINPSEFDNARKQYFPQPGDKPAVIAQKKRNREMVVQGFARQAGPGGKDIHEVFSNPPPKTSQTAFQTVEEASSANLPKGTVITVNGRQAIVE